MITYEYPLNERIRTLLRLEDLFDKALHFIAADAQEDHHVALLTIFEILEVAARADLKFDLVQELERQRQTLLSFRNNPDISEDALSGALYEIELASAQMLAMQGKIGQYLREKKLASAMIDTSDGLSTDLRHICDESGVGAIIDSAALPSAPGDDELQYALHGGEDYELLFTAPPNRRIPRQIAGTPITRIGEITRARQINLRAPNGKSHPLKPGGWQHFA